MADRSGIGWTDATWNPTKGCSRKSEGCRHCYAEAVSARIANATQAKLRAVTERGGDERDRIRALSPTESAYRIVVRWQRGGDRPADDDDVALPRWNGRVVTDLSVYEKPIHWKRPRLIFVDSMSDLHHEALGPDHLDIIYGVMAIADRHRFQILTKRPDLARLYLSAPERPQKILDALRKLQASLRRLEEPIPELDAALERWGETLPWPLSNVIQGTSVENQAQADGRILELLRCPAAARFVSYEPALGPVDYEPWVWPQCILTREEHDANCEGGLFCEERLVDWIIVGGESGPQHRPMEIAWVEAVADVCGASDTALYVKQDAGARPGQQGRIPERLWARKEYPPILRPSV